MRRSDTMEWDWRTCGASLAEAVCAADASVRESCAHTETGTILARQQTECKKVVDFLESLIDFKLHSGAENAAETAANFLQQFYPDDGNYTTTTNDINDTAVNTEGITYTVEDNGEGNGDDEDNGDWSGKGRLPPTSLQTLLNEKEDEGAVLERSDLYRQTLIELERCVSGDVVASFATEGSEKCLGFFEFLRTTKVKIHTLRICLRVLLPKTPPPSPLAAATPAPLTPSSPQIVAIADSPRLFSQLWCPMLSLVFQPGKTSGGSSVGVAGLSKEIVEEVLAEVNAYLGWLWNRFSDQPLKVLEAIHSFATVLDNRAIENALPGKAEGDGEGDRDRGDSSFDCERLLRETLAESDWQKTFDAVSKEVADLVSSFDPFDENFVEISQQEFSLGFDDAPDPENKAGEERVWEERVREERVREERVWFPVSRISIHLFAVLKCLSKLFSKVHELLPLLSNNINNGDGRGNGRCERQTQGVDRVVCIDDLRETLVWSLGALMTTRERAAAKAAALSRVNVTVSATASEAAPSAAASASERSDSESWSARIVSQGDRQNVSAAFEEERRIAADATFDGREGELSEPSTPSLIDSIQADLDFVCDCRAICNFLVHSLKIFTHHNLPPESPSSPWRGGARPGPPSPFPGTAFSDSTAATVAVRSVAREWLHQRSLKNNRKFTEKKASLTDAVTQTVRRLESLSRRLTSRVREGLTSFFCFGGALSIDLLCRALIDEETGNETEMSIRKLVVQLQSVLSTLHAHHTIELWPALLELATSSIAASLFALLRVFLNEDEPPGEAAGAEGYRATGAREGSTSTGDRGDGPGFGGMFTTVAGLVNSTVGEVLKHAGPPTSLRDFTRHSAPFLPGLSTGLAANISRVFSPDASAVASSAGPPPGSAPGFGLTPSQATKAMVRVATLRPSDRANIAAACAILFDRFVVNLRLVQAAHTHTTSRDTHTHTLTRPHTDDEALKNEDEDGEGEGDWGLNCQIIEAAAATLAQKSLTPSPAAASLIPRQELALLLRFKQTFR